MIDSSQLLIALACLFAGIAACLWAFPALLDDVDIIALPSRMELITATSLLSLLMLFGAITLSSDKAKKPDEPRPESAQATPSWLARPSEQDSARVALEAQMAEEERKKPTTLDAVLKATEKCRSSTGSVIEQLDGEQPDMALAQRLAVSASRNCDGDRHNMAKLFMAQPANSLCNRVISANQALNRAVIHAAGDIGRLGSAEIVAYTQGIADAAANCDLALKP